MKLLIALLVAAAPVVAQPAAPAPAANEDPADVTARVRYERAIRADFDGRREDALREARACLDAKPDGRFADAARALIKRLDTGAPPAPQAAPVAASEPQAETAAPAPVRSTGVGPRTELVISSTVSGLYISSLMAAATDSREKGTVAWLMLGTGGTLAASIFATSGRHVPQSMPQMLQNGVGFGSWIAGISLSLANDSPSGNKIAGSIAAGATLGAVAGLASSPWLTGGDSGAMTNTMIYGGALPTALLYVLSGDKTNSDAYRWTALIGSSVGVFAGPLLNSQMHWSRGRWNLVSLGGGVGALMGGGVAVLAEAKNQSAAALVTAGAIGGLLLTGYLTSDFGADEAHPGSAALVHVEGAKVSLGNPAGALTPTVSASDKHGALLSLVDGRF